MEAEMAFIFTVTVLQSFANVRGFLRITFCCIAVVCWCAQNTLKSTHLKKIVVKLFCLNTHLIQFSFLSHLRHPQNKINPQFWFLKRQQLASFPKMSPRKKKEKSKQIMRSLISQCLMCQIWSSTLNRLHNFLRKDCYRFVLFKLIKRLFGSLGPETLEESRGF